MNLAIRDIRHAPARFILTAAGLGLLLGIVLAMIGIYRGLVDDALILARTPRADLWVVEHGTRGPFAEASRLPDLVRQMVEGQHGVAAAGGMTYQSVEVGVPRTLRLQVVGFERGRPGAPPAPVAGRGITRPHYELLADRRTGLRPGEDLQLGERRFTVVGLTDGQVSSGGDSAVYITLEDAQELQFELSAPALRRAQATGEGERDARQLNAVVIQVAAGVDPDRLAERIRRWKHLAVLTQAEQEAVLVQSVVAKARKQIGLFTAVLLLVSAAIIALILYTMTMDKVREIATLKLIGAADRTIVGLILQQALLIGGISFLFGAGLIYAAADGFPRRVLLLPLDALALGAVVLLVCLLASGLGVRLALRIDPAQALGG